MDFGFGEEQTALRRAAAEFLEKECPKTLVREMERDGKGYSPEIWRKMADLGWLGLVIPEDYGGAGGSFLELAILHEEIGRALLPSPYFATIDQGAQILLACGTKGQKGDLLPQIVGGKLLMTLALTEPGAVDGPAAISTRAIARGDEYLISGTKVFVPHGQQVDYLICVARTEERVSPEEGISLYLVAAKSPGITATPLISVSGEKLSEVAFEKVAVPKGNLLGKLGGGWLQLDKPLQLAKVALCAEMLGAAQAVFDMATKYAKERVQFGRPIGSFQCIQHKLADMVMEVDGARFITYKAAWLASQGQHFAKEAAMAKAYVGDVFRRASIEGKQIMGGYGFMEEYDMQLYFRRAATVEARMGGSDFQREIVAREMGF